MPAMMGDVYTNREDIQAGIDRQAKTLTRGRGFISKLKCMLKI